MKTSLSKSGTLVDRRADETKTVAADVVEDFARRLCVPTGPHISRRGELLCCSLP